MMPGNYDPSVPDEVISVDDAASFEMTRRLAAEEGLLVGGSSGMAVVAGLQAAQDLGEDDVMVIILPDSGRGYLGKIFNDPWMDAHGFETAPVESVLPAGGVPGGVPDGVAAPAAAAPGAGEPTGDWAGTVQDLLQAKPSVLPGSLPN